MMQRHSHSQAARRSPLAPGARLTASIAFALMVFVRSPFANAQDADARAREHYQRGVSLYQQGSFKDSLAELTQARELSHSYTILANIGQVRAAMSDYLGAIEAYRQYLGEGGARLSSTQRQDAQREINDCESRLAAPIVECDAPFAEVFVDSVRAGQTPLTLRLNPGNHVLKIRHKDYPEQQRQVTLAEGTHERISFSFASPTAPAQKSQATTAATVPTVPAAPTAHSPDHRSASPAQPAPPDLLPTQVSNPAGNHAQKHDVGRIVAWSAVGTLAAGAVVTGVWALFSNHSLAEKRDAPEPRDHSAMESEANKTRALAILADGCLVGAIGLGAWLTLDRNAFSTTNTGNSTGLQLRASLSQVSLRAWF